MSHEKSIKKNLKIGWIIAGDIKVASSRLQGFLIHDYLIENGYNSTIICSNFEKKHHNYSINFFILINKILKKKYDIVFLVRPNWMMFKMSELIRLNKIKTICVRCDYLPGNYDNHFDITVTPTIYLQESLGIRKFEIIDDMIETPRDLIKKNYNLSNHKYKVIWVGHGGYGQFISQFIIDLKKHEKIRNNFEFITVSSGKWATHLWDLETVYNYILDSDIAIIPIPESKEFQIKSTNRLTMFMSLGMPVIASPIKSYTDIAIHGQHCLFANSTDEFAKYLIKLKSESFRKKLGEFGRSLSITRYNKEVIGKAWCNLISNLSEQNTQKPNSNFHTKLLSKVISIF